MSELQPSPFCQAQPGQLPAIFAKGEPATLQGEAGVVPNAEPQLRRRTSWSRSGAVVHRYVIGIVGKRGPCRQISTQ